MVVFGRPITVPADASKETMEARRAELEAVMREITDIADRHWDK